MMTCACEGAAAVGYYNTFKKLITLNKCLSCISLTKLNLK